jgi:RNA methyltransferase, TrmH family
MSELTSLQNPQVKYVVKLREDRRQRTKDGLTLVEGEYELELALASGLIPVEVYHCPELASGTPKLITEYDLVQVTRPVFEKMSLRENPDGWLAIMPARPALLESLTISPVPFILMAEAVEKPGNLGAMLRTADAAGVDALLVCDQRVDLYSPNVVRASRGTIFSVPCVETNNKLAYEWLCSKQIRILAATPRAEKMYTEVDLTQPLCIAVGTEDEGLSEFWLQNSDLQVKIPMAGKVNSLNVSTSTAVLLYEAVRQRHSN